MARASRICCVSIPFILTLASFACLLLVFLGQINARSSSIERPFFFLRIDTSIFGEASDVAQKLGIPADVDIADWYTIGLWNYCSGETNSTMATFTNASSTVPSYCSPRHAFFWFNPLQVWRLENTPVQDLVPSQWQDALNAYQTASKWMFICYVIAIIATLVTVVLAIFAFCGRLGSLFTTLTAAVGCVFAIGASAVATAIFSTVKGVIDEKLGSYGVTTALGGTQFAVTWLGAAFAAVSGIFWIATICCCSGRSKESHYKGDNTRRTGTWGYGEDAYHAIPSPHANGDYNAFGGSHSAKPENGRWYANQTQYQGAGYEPYTSRA